MERAIEVPSGNAGPADAMLTDRLIDITPQALRMSSPFNTSYWLAVA